MTTQKSVPSRHNVFQFFLMKIRDFLRLPWPTSKIVTFRVLRDWWTLSKSTSLSSDMDIDQSSHLSLPTCFSSNTAQLPSTLSFRSWTVVNTAPPHALSVRRKSSSGTRPAQNISLQKKKKKTFGLRISESHPIYFHTYLSAKYWVATSPIGNLDKTTWAPLLQISSNLLYRISHSASTIFWYSCKR